MNNIVLIGRLTKDPELQATSSGTSYCQISLAVDRNYKSADGENQADFFKCTAWNKTAENIAKYVHKGNLLGIQGELQTEQWEKDGVKHYGVNIRINQCQFLNSKSDNEASEAAASTGSKPVPVQDEAELPF